MGHRWAAFVAAKVNGETIPVGPVHCAGGLHATMPFPYQRPTEASSWWWPLAGQFDGTLTRLGDAYYVPDTG